MSSVDWKKIHGSAAGLISHATRHDGRDVNYSNPDIDTTKSADNYTVGRWKNSTRSVEYFLSSRLKELDRIHKPKRIRKDRVTRIGFCVTAPEGLKSWEEPRFFRMAHEEIAKTCGGRENVTGGFVHVDEKHQYYDKLKGEYVMSRAHMHEFGIPWTDEHGVNAKHFMTRERMRDLNQRIEKRCMEMFHVHFLTGDKSRSGRDTEDLKRESLACELERAERRLLELSFQEQELSVTIDEEKALKRSLEAQNEALKDELDKLSQEVDKKPQRVLKRACEFMDKYKYDENRTFFDKFQQEEKKRSRGLEH